MFIWVRGSATLVCVGAAEFLLVFSGIFSAFPASSGSISRLCLGGALYDYYYFSSTQQSHTAWVGIGLSTGRVWVSGPKMYKYSSLLYVDNYKVLSRLTKCFVFQAVLWNLIHLALCVTWSVSICKILTTSESWEPLASCFVTHLGFKSCLYIWGPIPDGSMSLMGDGCQCCHAKRDYLRGFILLSSCREMFPWLWCDCR